MSDKTFVVLVTVAGAGDITVRYHPNPTYLKKRADKVEPRKGVMDAWPRDIRSYQLKNAQGKVTTDMLGHYIEITTASGKLEWNTEITSAELHKGSYKHLGL